MMKFKTMDCGRTHGYFQVPKHLIGEMNWGNDREFCCVKHAEEFFQEQRDYQELSNRDYMWKYNKQRILERVT